MEVGGWGRMLNVGCRIEFRRGAAQKPYALRQRVSYSILIVSPGPGMHAFFGSKMIEFEGAS